MPVRLSGRRRHVETDRRGARLRIVGSEPCCRRSTPRETEPIHLLGQPVPPLVGGRAQIACKCCPRLPRSWSLRTGKCRFIRLPDLLRLHIDVGWVIGIEGSRACQPQTPTAVQQLPDAQSALLLHAHPAGAGEVEHVGGAQVGQQLPVPAVVPLGHAPSRRVWHIPQSALVVQLTVGSFEQVPVVAGGTMMHVGVQVENPDFPHVDRAAQRVTLPLQFVGSRPHDVSSLTRWATQLTYRPWLDAPVQEHCVLTA